MRILVHEQNVFNIDNDADAEKLLAQGARELTDGEITATGMTGYEHLVSPANTTVGEDGRIIFTPPEPEPLETVKARKLAAIDAETSAAILAGFACEATPPDTGQPELLHFSYDAFDQQNFADAALSMQLAAAAGGAIPTSTPWNAYRGHTADSKGELVILQLTAETFVPIYATALQHKAAKMAEGGQRKAAVAAARTVEEVEDI